MRHVHLNALAEGDLIGIWRYTSGQWGAEQADNYLDELDQGIAQLAHNAAMGAERGNVRSGYRVSANEVRIIRVLHGQMDPDTHLRE
jgi:toxin ParE1/3/4